MPLKHPWPQPAQQPLLLRVDDREIIENDVRECLQVETLNRSSGTGALQGA